MEARRFLFSLTAVITLTFACARVGQEVGAEDLITGLDAVNQSFSNVTITNATSSSIPASGIFIASFDVNDCSACTGNIMAGDNAFGAFVQPITFGASQTLRLGQNFLYNMLYNGIYGIKNTAGSSPCELPGCSWPGDDPTIQGWCITLNVMSRESSYTFSHYANGTNPLANVVPAGQAGVSNPFNYKFDLKNPATLGAGAACIGPIKCNDKTLTCSVTSPQNQTFEAY